MFFLGLVNPDLSELRVIDRVKEGGHYVPRNTVEDNYYGNLEKLNKYFSILDHLNIIDTSESEPVLLASFANGEAIASIPVNNLPMWFIENLTNLVKKIKTK